MKFLITVINPLSIAVGTMYVIGLLSYNTLYGIIVILLILGVLAVSRSMKRNLLPVNEAILDRFLQTYPFVRYLHRWMFLALACAFIITFISGFYFMYVVDKPSSDTITEAVEYVSDKTGQDVSLNLYTKLIEYSPTYISGKIVLVTASLGTLDKVIIENSELLQKDVNDLTDEESIQVQLIWKDIDELSQTIDSAKDAINHNTTVGLILLLVSGLCNYPATIYSEWQSLKRKEVH